MNSARSKLKVAALLWCLLMAMPVAAQKKPDPETDGYNWATDGLRGKVKSIRLEAPPSTAGYDHGSNKPMVTVTSYDSGGRRIKQSVFQPADALLYEEVYSYSKTGKLIERRHYGKNSQPASSMTYEYNDKDWLTSVIHREPDGVVALKVTYRYDDSGKKTLKILTATRSPDYNYVSRYDERERLVEETETRDNATTHHRRIEYDYYPTGRLRKAAMHELMREPVMGQAEIYDENGNRTEFIRYGADGKIELRELFKYDERENVAEIAFYGEGGEQREVIKSRYEYDKHGNWIRQQDESIEGGRLPKYVMTRTITYFHVTGSPRKQSGSAAKGLRAINFRDVAAQWSCRARCG